MSEKPATRDPRLTTQAHSIRLRHPWQSVVQGDALVWSRKFNWPAALDAGERVELVVEKAPTSAFVTLNENELGTAVDCRFDVTSLLSGHNLLTLTVANGESDEGERFPYDVRLEIVADAAEEEDADSRGLDGSTRGESC